MKNAGSRGSYTFDRPGNYRVCVQGRLNENWADRLGGMRITTDKSEGQERVTTLTGPLVDQAELAGVLNALYELHLSLLSVEFLGEVEPKKG